jgi:hypothetical protein
MTEYGYSQESYRGFIIDTSHEGTDGEVTSYNATVDSPLVSDLVGEEIGSSMGGFTSIEEARAFIDEQLPDVVPTHTPEPWAQVPKRGSAHIWSEPSGVVVAGVGGATKEEERANLERIVACVNGCAGLPDPGVVAAMREVIEALYPFLRHSTRISGDSLLLDDDRTLYQHVRDIMIRLDSY